MAVNPQLNSPLFALPHEVRSRIYAFHLAFEEADFFDTLRPFFVYLDNGPYYCPLPALLQTCKRAYLENREEVHHSAILKITMSEWSVRLGFAAHGTLCIERLHTMVLVVRVEHPYWNRWLSFFSAVAARAAPSLRELVVDWHPRRPGPMAKWDAALHRKKEGEFLRALGAIGTGLQTVRLYGKDVPAHWKEELAAATGARVVAYRFHWWRDPGRGW